ncbi:hypothetical protein SBOR_4123 [Sclerotinia borealis F-4128]|uniref:Uncharacterized protein n=1 Tax=Sclerotinia borealis (strain F-4128) TaxID=1432307 RepID=W9CLD4_SCLBF|nr:hypothetical protein SBOR_4123 [Sclerotinia borealis F-4128]
MTSSNVTIFNTSFGTNNLSYTWTASEKRFLQHVCRPYNLKISTADWNHISDVFATEQVRHFAGGDLHATDSWPPRPCTWERFKKAYARYVKDEEKKRQEAAHTMLNLAGVSVGAAGRQEQEQEQEQNQNLQVPEGGIRLSASRIPIPEGSILLPDGTIRLPCGSQIVVTNVVNPVPQAENTVPVGGVRLPDGRIRLANGRHLLPDDPMTPNPAPQGEN